MAQDSDAFFNELPEDLEACCRAAEHQKSSPAHQDSSPAQPGVAQPESIQVAFSLCARLIVWTGQR